MTEFHVESMTCGHCVGRVTKAIEAVDPHARVECDLAAHKVRVDSQEDRETIAGALVDAGYPTK
jgi:copper chaperone CopZ